MFLEFFAMALSFKDPETDALARQVAQLTGETLTEAVRGALAERLRHEQLKRGQRPWNDGGNTQDRRALCFTADS